MFLIICSTLIGQAKSTFSEIISDLDTVNMIDGFNSVPYGETDCNSISKCYMYIFIISLKRLVGLIFT